MLDNTLDATGLLLCSALRLTLVTGFLVLVPLTCKMLVNMCREQVLASIGDLP
jgi:hypothetical protein